MKELSPILRAPLSYLESCNPWTLVSLCMKFFLTQGLMWKWPPHPLRCWGSTTGMNSAMLWVLPRRIHPIQACARSHISIHEMDIHTLFNRQKQWRPRSHLSTSGETSNIHNRSLSPAQYSPYCLLFSISYYTKSDTTCSASDVEMEALAVNVCLLMPWTSSVYFKVSVSGNFRSGEPVSLCVCVSVYVSIEQLYNCETESNH